jgi:hypothetical protein
MVSMCAPAAVVAGSFGGDAERRRSEPVFVAEPAGLAG